MASEVNTTPPTTRTLDWAAIVRRVWGDSWHARDDVYIFSNDRRFKSTDDSDHGIYDGS